MSVVLNSFTCLKMILMRPTIYSAFHKSPPMTKMMVPKMLKVTESLNHYNKGWGIEMKKNNVIT